MLAVLGLATAGMNRAGAQEPFFGDWPVEEAPDSIMEFEEFADFAEADHTMRLAVVLSDIYSKKDMEFTRGLLLGMKHARLEDGSVALKVINGEIPEDSLEYELGLFSPHNIISTFDKDAPNTLRAYSQENGAGLLAPFEARGDDYLYNENVYRLLAPSETFNKAVGRYVIESFPGNTLVIVGDPDPTDFTVRDIILEWPEDELMIVSQADLKAFSLEDETNYLFYPLISDKEEVKGMLDETLRMIAETPSAGVRIIGRPNWISFNDLQTMTANLEVYVPAKCYFDPSTGRGKRLIGTYNAAYGHAPIRSYPVYAVMGYDTATYFLPRLGAMVSGQEADWTPADMEQSYFNMERSDGGGMYNRGGYMLHYTPWGTMTKEIVE